MHQKNFISWLININILVLFILPDLNTAHYDPLPEFWAETTFTWAAITLFLLTCFAFDKIYIPKITIPLLAFAIFLVVQPYFVTIDFIGLSYVAALEMLVCILLAISMNTLIQKFSLNKIISIICYALVIGALLQSIIGFLQYSSLYKYFSNLLFYDSAHPNTNIFGHFGQRNHYCHYLSWAVFSLIYLFHQGRIKLPAFSIITAWFIFSITIAASRSVFLYFACASLITGAFYIINQTASTRKLFILVCLTSIILVATEYLYPIIIKALYHQSNLSSGLQRITAEAGDSGIWGRRMVEWYKAWIVFKSSPIVGYGWNEYAKQSVYLQPIFPNAPLNSGLFTNCHNLILQLLAETGIIGTFIVVLGLLYTIYAIIKLNSPECIIILCMIFTTLIHSMVEYPLWYMYFLGPLIIFLAIDKPIVKLSSNLIAAIVIVPLSTIIYLMFQGSLIFNTLVYYIDSPIDSKPFITQSKYLENLANHNVLWAYPALYVLDSYIIMHDANTNKCFSIQTQLQYENKFSNFHPYPDNIIKQAILNWDLGNKEKARQLVNLALVAYPVYKNSYLNSLKNNNYQELYKIVKAYKYPKI